MSPTKNNRHLGTAEGHEELLSDHVVVEKIINASPNGVMLIDRQGQVLLANPSLDTILGLDHHQMAGQRWTDFFARDKNRALAEAVEEVLAGKAEKRTLEMTYFTPQGQRRQLIVTCTLMSNGNNGTSELSAVLVVFNDVSELWEQRQREKQLMQRSQRLYREKAEGLNRVARAVAHEIRNPVTSLGGLTLRLLAKQEPGGQEEQYLRRILASTGRLETLVNQLGAYTGLPAPHLRETPMADWLGGIVASYQPEAVQRGVSLQWSKPAGPVARLTARIDPDLLARALRVLMDNALEAMPDGGKLKVSLHRANGELEIVVSDTGRGIDPADLPYLFDPFFTTKADAVGMSLALAKRITADHEGDLTVISEPQKGSTFTISLPLEGPLGLPADTRPAREQQFK